MKTKNLILAVLAIMFITSTSIMAQPGEGKGKCKNLPGLTEEQSKKIDALKTTHLKEMMPLKNQMDEKKAQLKTLTTGDKVDMATVNKKIDEIGALKTDMMKKREAHRQEVRKILNDEQRLMFDMHHGKMGRGHGKGHGNGHGKGMGGKQMHGKGQGCEHGK